MEKKVHNLDLIAVSPQIFNAWKNHVIVKVAEWYDLSGRLENINISEIPDEQFNELENGDGEIFITMPDKVEIILNVPKGHWSWIKTIAN